MYCIAASFCCDASVDQTQKDNEYMLLNTVNKDLKFIGIGHVTESGAAAHLEGLKTDASDTVGFDKVLKVVNHLSTDGKPKILYNTMDFGNFLMMKEKNFMLLSPSSNLFVLYIQLQT